MCDLAKDDFTMFVRRELALGGHEMLVPGADVEDARQQQKQSMCINRS